MCLFRISIFVIMINIILFGIGQVVAVGYDKINTICELEAQKFIRKSIQKHSTTFSGYSNHKRSICQFKNILDKSIHHRASSSRTFSNYNNKKNVKILSLNIWGGNQGKTLLSFIDAHKEADVFCFQEVYKKAPYRISTDENIVNLDIFSDIQAVLSDHKGFFRPVVEGIYGLATFVRKDIDILGEGEVTIHETLNYSGRGPTHSRILQWVNCHHSGSHPYSIMNIHGLWNGLGKSDTPSRIAQSNKIRNFIDKISIPKILCGDFNLEPNTESILIISDKMRNLIKEYEINSTRTNLYSKPIKHADYMFISPNVSVKIFKVLPDIVSDHAPLLLEVVLPEK